MSAMQTRTVAGLLLLRDRAVGLADLGAAFPQYDSRAGFFVLFFWLMHRVWTEVSPGLCSLISRVTRFIILL